VKFDFSSIFAFLDTIAKLAAVTIPGAQLPASLADGLLQMVIKAKAAHEAITGKPLDLANLPNISDIP